MTLPRLLDPRRWPSLMVFGMALVGAFVVCGAIVALGIRMMGSQAAFEAAWGQTTPWLFLWRWACYAGLVVGWMKLWRPRLVRQLVEDTDGGEEARLRLKRLERYAIGVMVVIELFNLIDWMGGGQ